MKKFCLFAVLIVSALNVFSQTQRGQGGQMNPEPITINGIVRDQADKSPLPGAHISLRNMRDTTRVYNAITDSKGNFSISATRGGYLMKVSFIGYQPVEKNIRATENPFDTGITLLSQADEFLAEVQIAGQASTAILKGDTIQFNATAFKANPDASAEDLIRKMPGITVDGTGVKAQGEDVKKVLVDGREFFGDDPSIALRNLPADMIERIQVYDRMSDQSQLTGFDDGQAVKTINIITRLDRRTGQFGKVYSGYGDENRYQAGLSTNIFKNNTRISIIGMSNNINQQNFTSEDLSGFMSSGGRPGMGGGMGSGTGLRSVAGGASPLSSGGVDRGEFIIGQRSGYNTTHSLGLNYTDIWKEKVNVNSSYFINIAKNDTERLTDRQYFLDETASRFYNELSLSNSNNFNHRFNARIEYKINENNTLFITPRFNIQKTESNSFSNALNTLDDNQLLSESETGYDRIWDGYTFSNGLLYRLRMNESGRSLTTTLNTNINNNQYLYFLDALSSYYEGPIFTSDIIDQKSNSNTQTMGINSNVTYTEPLGSKSLLQLSYNISYSDNNSDRTTNSWDIINQAYSSFENDLSNELTNGYLTNRAGIGYRLRGEKSNLQADISFQHAGLSADQKIPYEVEINRSFKTILPMFMYTYNYSKTQNLRMNYRTFTNAPSVNQLQDVVDNSNPLLLSSGNPNLKQSYSHFFMTRYSNIDAPNSKTFFAFLFGNLTNDYIGSYTLIAQKDTILPNGYLLPKGAQFSQPVNMNGFGNIRGMLTYGFPFRAIKSNINLTSGLSYSRMPGIINDVTNVSNTYNVSGGITLSSNISEKVDFTLSYNATYNIAENSIRTQLNSNYFYHITGIKFNWIFGNGWVVRNDVNNLLYTGLGETFNENYWLWNLNIGKKMFTDKQAELTLGVYDLLDQNKSVSRNITNTYVEDSRTNILNRFFMLTFTYNIRHFRL
jgi:hypothetical protein